jgi:hypothetical protein
MRASADASNGARADRHGMRKLPTDSIVGAFLGCPTVLPARASAIYQMKEIEDARAEVLARNT